jgi:hypothetical protein
MAVPSSGTLNLSLFKIAKEMEVTSNLGYDNTMPYSVYRDSINGATPVSLKNMSTGAGGFDAINSGSSSKPNGTIPYSMAEFYGYDHDASPLTQIGSTYSAGSYSNTSWENISINVGAYKGKTVRFVWHYVSGTSYTGDIQIDNIAVPTHNNYWTQSYYNLGLSSFNGSAFLSTTTSNTSNYAEASFGSISTSTSGYGRWVGRSGSTPSSNTGLSSGYGGSGYYVYAETSSSGYPSKNFWLRTDPVILAYEVGSPYFGFRLGRYGSTIGTLKIYVEEI